MLCQGTGHTWMQSLWESFQLKWYCWIKSSNHLVMVRENWFPLNLHKAIHCWKLTFVYSTRGAHQPMNQSGGKRQKQKNPKTKQEHKLLSMIVERLPEVFFEKRKWSSLVLMKRARVSEAQLVLTAEENLPLKSLPCFDLEAFQERF